MARQERGGCSGLLRCGKATTFEGMMNDTHYVRNGCGLRVLTKKWTDWGLVSCMVNDWLWFDKRNLQT